MRNTKSFTLADRTFTITNLDPMTSLRALKHVSAVVVPALSAVSSDADADLAKAIGGLENLPQLAEIFRAVCKVSWEGKEVDLSAFFADVFSGSPALLLAWLVECVKFEYADFLAESGRNLLAGTVKGLDFLTASPGKSGGS